MLGRTTVVYFKTCDVPSVEHLYIEILWSHLWKCWADREQGRDSTLLVELESFSWLLLLNLAPITFGPLAKLAKELGRASCTLARWWQRIKGQMTTASRPHCSLVIHDLNTWHQTLKRRRSFEYCFIITKYTKKSKCNEKWTKENVTLVVIDVNYHVCRHSSLSYRRKMIMVMDGLSESTSKG